MNRTGLVLHSFTLLFTAFKLAHIIDWSWAWVTLPSWLPIALGMTLFALGHLLLWHARRGMNPYDRARAEAADRLEEYADEIERRLGR